MSVKVVLKTLIIASALCSAIVPQAYAGPAAGLARPLRIAPPSQFIAASRYTLAPFAFVRFCRDNHQDCEAGQGEAMVSLSPSLRAELYGVNSVVNRSI